MKNIIRFEEKPKATHRLFCFPYAGAASSAFRLWTPLLPPQIELCAIDYPGRVHLKNAPADTMEALIEEILPDIKSLSDIPFCYYGHSFGSLVAYECARHHTPKQLFVSSRRAPQVPNPDVVSHLLSDEEFLRVMMEVYEAIPAVILNEKELLKLFLPTLKADLKLNEIHVASIDPPLSIPVTLYHGKEDHSYTKENLLKWSEVTTGPYEIVQFEGGHFFIDTHRKEFVDAICKKVLSA